MRVVKYKIHFYHNIFGARMYEGQVTYEDGKQRRGVTVPFPAIPDKAGIQRFPSIKKAEAWLNSEEGLKYLTNKEKVGV